MLHVERFINELMSSNCYLVVDEESKHCICIDPASEKSKCEIEYIDRNQLKLDYILLTHEHTDHTWGVNSLIDAYPAAKVVCSEMCKVNLQKEFQAYFLFYYDNPNYYYTVCNVDVTTEELKWRLNWHGKLIEFLPTPGHSMGSVCVVVEGMLFTGDAILQSKPYINKRNGSKELYFESVNKVVGMFPGDTLVFPGHGDTFLLKNYQNQNI